MSVYRRASIRGYEGFYEVDTEGRVYSVDRWVIGPRGRPQHVPTTERKLSAHGTGYLTVRLAKQGKVKTHRVHRLVAETFIENPHNLPDVNHEDTNKHNNREDNLEWCDAFGNMKHAVENGLTASGFRNAGAKLSKENLEAALFQVEAGAKLKDIAITLNVNNHTISKALDRVFGLGWRKSQKPQYRKKLALASI